MRLALSDVRDEEAEDLVIVSVEPAPDSSHLRVLVADAGGHREPDIERLRGLLKRLEGRLRAAVALAVHRKRAPTLSFVVVPSNDQAVR